MASILNARTSRTSPPPTRMQVYDMRGSSVWLAIKPTAAETGLLRGAHAERLLPVPCLMWVADCGRTSCTCGQTLCRRSRDTAIRPKTGSRCGVREVGRLLRPCTAGCTISCRASPVRPIWRRPCNLRHDIGQASGPSSTIGVSR